MPEAPDQKPAGDNAPKPLKSTLNLPQTAFPMKASLPIHEPLRLKQWQDSDLYGQIRRARAGSPRYILHDGPPYANGAIHLGHALNKTLKDFVVKTKTMAGFDAPYVPGWDCHGLPIEIKVDEQLGLKKLQMDPVAVRQACRLYAQKYLDLQRSQFIRMGVFGRWATPYSTMDPVYEARIAETFFHFFEHGFFYKGLKPVSWCIHDRTALAEAEVEYEQHTSPSVYVRYKLTSDPAAIFGSSSEPDAPSSTMSGAPSSRPHLGAKVGDAPQNPIFTIIWTTTPWTLPASLAVAFHPDFEYVALATPEATYIVAASLAAEVIAACNLTDAREIARFPGTALDRTTFQHPFLDRTVLGTNATYVTNDTGTGAVHTAPAHGVDDFATGKRYDLPEVQYVDDAGRQIGTERFGGGQPQPYEGLTVFKSNPVIIELLKERGALLAVSNMEHSYPHCWRCHKPVITRATEQWFIKMDTEMTAPDGTNTTFRQRAIDQIKTVTWDPAWGQERITNMVLTRPDWCISRQKMWGVPIAVFLCSKCGEPLRSPEINKSIVALFMRESADAWFIRTPEEILPAGTACVCGHTDFRKEMDMLDVWFEPAPAPTPSSTSTPMSSRSPTTPIPAPTSTPRAATSIAAGSCPRCSAPSACTTAPPSSPSPPTAGRSTRRAAPSPSPSATSSTPSPSWTPSVATSSASGSPASTSVKTSSPASPSSSVSPKRSTASCATPSASSSARSAKPIPPPASPTTSTRAPWQMAATPSPSSRCSPSTSTSSPAPPN